MDRMVVTGGAGFIGSNLAEHLIAQGYEVVVVDNFSTGQEKNLSAWAEQAGSRLQVVRADINDTDALRGAFQGARFVFHQAAIPSVPRSVADPQGTHKANVSGTLSVLVAARDLGVKRVVMASSSSVYGDDPQLPKVESRTGNPLSPYALSKMATEEYGRLFYRVYGLESVYLRYFNVFGPRQDPKSEYAAVIPRFATRLIAGQPPTIYGDGEQTRDFTFVSNVVDANWKAATHPGIAGEAFNIGCGIRTSLNQLARQLNGLLGTDIRSCHEPARVGDVPHSLADVRKAQQLMAYTPAVPFEEGLRRILQWYRRQMEGGDGVS
jgi:nucleoside-diphosphate-sugar epimerase